MFNLYINSESKIIGFISGGESLVKIEGEEFKTVINIPSISAVIKIAERVNLLLVHIIE